MTRVGGRLVLGPTKSRAGQRTLPIVDLARAALDEQSLRQERHPGSMQAGLRGTTHVFTTRSGQPVDPGNLSRSFDRMVATAGLPRISFRDLRRIAATSMKDLGVPARDAQVILGHSDISVTLGIYSEVFDPQLRSAMARMNHALKAEQDAIAPRCACGAAVEDRTATARNGHARSRMTRHQGRAVLPGISQFGPEDTPRGSTATPMSSTEDPPGAPWLPRRLVDRPVVSRPGRVAEVEGRSFVHALALAHGLGLVGVGAPAAIREFLIEALAFKEPGSTVIVVPALDLAELLGQRTLALPHRPAGLEVTATFDDALDLLEIHALSRAMGPSGSDPYSVGDRHSY